MYATIEQAKDYIKQFYSSKDALRISWEALEPDDQQVLLNRASQLIDQLPLRGVPLGEGSAFPRAPHEEHSLDAAKRATIEVAIQRQNNEAVERFNLQSQGVKSYRIGDLSEDFGGGLGLGLDAFTLSIAFPFLQNWLGGGYQICRTRINR